MEPSASSGEAFASGCGHPRTHEILLEVDGRSAPMQPVSGGWHNFNVAEVGAGTRYVFQLPDGTKVPDPASRFQPEDVHGPSEVIDPTAYRRADGEWGGRP